jgi:hypothetical protein
MKESPTDFLIRSLEKIEDAEDVVIVVRRKGSSDVDWFANDVPLYVLLGMLDFAGKSMFEDAINGDEDDE